MTRPITLAGFEATFRGNPDPWNTFNARDEIRKRRAIAHALGGARYGRVLELASGNGSNTRMIARRALRLDAVDGAERATALTRAVAAPLGGRVTVAHLSLPGRFPHRRYDAIVAAEILYYLDANTLRATAREVVGTLRPGGILVLAHSHIRFADAALPPAEVHHAFSHGRPLRRDRSLRTDRWRVERFVRL